MSANKQRGTAAETAIVNYLRQWFPWADRVPLSGARDRGDVTLGPGSPVHEVKHVARHDLAGWLDEAEAEAVNANAPFGVAWFKRRGTTDPGRWYVLMSGRSYVRLLAEAGYGADARAPHVEEAS